MIPASLPGNGPWMIDPACLSRTHNTLRSAIGGKRRIKCTCPHAVDLRREKDREWSKLRKEQAKIGAPQKDIPVSQPDMSAGECNSPYGALAADAAFEGAAGYAGMRSLCAVCPIRLTLCKPYVVEAERPAGSWGGVWAGMSPRERVRQAVTS